MRLSFPQPILTALPIVQRLREFHFEAVFVGGAVRDTILGLPIKDVDIATSARPEQVLELFERCIPTGLQHGTITVILDDITYEVTTFRQESAYEAHRKPESVLYITELDDDLLRRDFTMNAMALDGQGELYDPYGGINDLKSHVLRCVGDPNARFQEDALRMLRAVRFIAVYKLTPSLRTWKAVIRYRELLKYVAMERVQIELDKMIAGDSPQRALHFVAASGLLFHLKQTFDIETEHQLKQMDRTAHAKKLFERLCHLSSIDSRWAAIAIGLNLSVNAVRQALQVLKFSNTRSKAILSMVALHHEMLHVQNETNERELHLSWLSIVIHYGKKTSKDWLQVMHILQFAEQSFSNGLLSRLEDWHDQMIVSTIKQLSVTGKDLTNHLQRDAGPWVSDGLNKLLLLVAIGEINNDKNMLLEQASLLPLT